MLSLGSSGIWQHDFGLGTNYPVLGLEEEDGSLTLKTLSVNSSGWLRWLGLSFSHLSGEGLRPCVTLRVGRTFKDKEQCGG